MGHSSHVMRRASTSNKSSYRLVTRVSPLESMHQRNFFPTPRSYLLVILIFLLLAMTVRLLWVCYTRRQEATRQKFPGLPKWKTETRSHAFLSELAAEDISASSAYSRSEYSMSQGKGTILLDEPRWHSYLKRPHFGMRGNISR